MPCICETHKILFNGKAKQIKMIYETWVKHDNSKTFDVPTTLIVHQLEDKDTHALILVIKKMVKGYKGKMQEDTEQICEDTFDVESLEIDGKRIDLGF